MIDVLWLYCYFPSAHINSIVILQEILCQIYFQVFLWISHPTALVTVQKLLFIISASHPFLLRIFSLTNYLIILISQESCYLGFWHFLLSSLPLIIRIHTWFKSLLFTRTFCFHIHTTSSIYIFFSMSIYWTIRTWLPAGLRKCFLCCVNRG